MKIMGVQLWESKDERLAREMKEREAERKQADDRLLTDGKAKHRDLEAQIVKVTKTIGELRHSKASLQTDLEKWTRLRDFAVSSNNETSLRQAVEKMMEIQTSLDEIDESIGVLKDQQKTMEAIRDEVLANADKAKVNMVGLKAREAAAEVRQEMAKDAADGELADTQGGALKRLEHEVQEKEDLAAGYEAMAATTTEGVIETVDAAAKKRAVDDEVKRLLNKG